MQEISNLISNVGFPIVACIFLYLQQKEQNKFISDISVTLKTIDTRIDRIERENVA